MSEPNIKLVAFCGSLRKGSFNRLALAAFTERLPAGVTLSTIVGRKVTWDARKSNPGRGDFWAPCPFHQEKSPSFHVDDRKGFYYCFGCHAKGDAVTFVKETENVGFMEAVEILAREAGMPMPARDPRAAQVADRRSQLVAVMEEAVKWFRLQLRTSTAAPARDYLDRRRMSPEAQDRWEIGFAPDQRQQDAHQAAPRRGLRLAQRRDVVADGGEDVAGEHGRVAGAVFRQAEHGAHLDRQFEFWRSKGVRCAIRSFLPSLKGREFVNYFRHAGYASI